MKIILLTLFIINSLVYSQTYTGGGEAGLIPDYLNAYKWVKYQTRRRELFSKIDSRWQKCSDGKVKFETFYDIYFYHNLISFFEITDQIDRPMTKPDLCVDCIQIEQLDFNKCIFTDTIRGEITEISTDYPSFYKRDLKQGISTKELERDVFFFFEGLQYAKNH